MVTLVRLEAEGKALAEVVKALDAQKVPAELRVHDEHYERVHDTLFKGRRVFRIGEKSPGANAGLRVTLPMTSGTAATSLSYLNTG